MRTFVIISALTCLVSADFASRDMLLQARAANVDQQAFSQDAVVAEDRPRMRFAKAPRKVLLRKSRQQRPLKDYGLDDSSSDFGSFDESNFGFDQSNNQQQFGRRPAQNEGYRGGNRQQQQQQDGASYDEFGNRQRHRNFNRVSEARPQPPQQQRPQRHQRPLHEMPTENRPYRTVDVQKEAVIEDVIAEPQDVIYYNKPASSPSYPDDFTGDQSAQPRFDVADDFNGNQMAAPRFDPIPYHGGDGEPAEQRSIEEAVINGANAYKPDGVFQTEDRLDFQIHGHKGPHSYRYGYDTGHGYNRQFRYEERDGEGYVKGRYGFFDKYGKLQVVNYSADPYKGFHAEGDHVPQYPH